MKRVELAFIGMGAAAMSLATRLAIFGYQGSAVFIEPNTGAGGERTWCGWGPSQHPFAAQITRRWTQWAVSHQGDELITGHAAVPYEMLRSTAVRDSALSVINERENWQILGGRTFANAQSDGDDWILTLDDGQQIKARWVFDARPPQLTLQRPWVWQSFIGFELSGQDFGPNTTVRLMDFIDDGEPLATFVYELPITSNRRLVEITRFTPEPADMTVLRTRLERIISTRGWTAHIDREESGHLPMAPVPAYAKDGWLRIGTAGGSMRPATGYAFHAIQLWADQCTAAMIQGNRPVPPSRSRLLDWLDGVFLESLWQNPGGAGEQFVQLFRRTPPEALVRFLMSRPTLLDTWRILCALPFARMLRAAWHHSWRPSR